MSASATIIKEWVTRAGLIGLIADDGHLCGYVALDGSSPFWEVDYGHEALSSLEVHGGLTFSGRLKAYNNPDFWLLGFDCAHYQDTREVCTPEYVEAEVENMAAKLAIV